MRTEQGKLYLLVAIDRTSKFAFVERHKKATRRVAGDFLRHLAAAVPYRINTVLTGNPFLSEVEGGTHFTDPTGDGWTPKDIKEMRAQKLPFRCHSFELACADLDIQHRLTKPRHSWTNGQVERMNRGGSRNLHSGDKWIADLTAAMLAASRRQDEQVTMPEPQPGV